MFVWDVADTILQLVDESSVTQQAIVSAVYSLLDLLGFIASFVMKAELLLQLNMLTLTLTLTLSRVTPQQPPFTSVAIDFFRSFSSD